MTDEEYLTELMVVHAKLDELLRHHPLSSTEHAWTRGRIGAFVDTAYSSAWSAICSIRVHIEQSNAT